METVEIADLANLKDTNWETMLTSLSKMAVDFGLQLLAAVLILTVGMWLAKRFTRHIRRIMKLRNLEPSLQTFLGSFVSIISKIFVVIIALTTVGVQMTSIVAVLGAASLAVGMALSGTLQNLAGGLVILLFKPFRVGETILTASGQMGVVKKIMIFTTELHTFDNQVIFLPNGALSNGEITNMSREPRRRTDLTVGISYGDDVDAARRAILAIIKKDKRITNDSTPTVFIKELGDSAVVLTVRYWTTYADMYTVMADLQEAIYTTLPKKKIHFPFPQMDVHVIK